MSDKKKKKREKWNKKRISEKSKKKKFFKNLIGEGAIGGILQLYIKMFKVLKNLWLSEFLIVIDVLNILILL